MFSPFSPAQALSAIAQRHGWAGELLFEWFTSSDVSLFSKQRPSGEPGTASAGGEDPDGRAYGSNRYRSDPYGSATYDSTDEAGYLPYGSGNVSGNRRGGSLLQDPNLQAGNGMAFGPAQSGAGPPAQADMPEVRVPGVRPDRSAAPVVGYDWEFVDDGQMVEVPTYGPPRAPRRRKTTQGAPGGDEEVVVHGRRPERAIPDWRPESDVFAPRVFDPGYFDTQRFERVNPSRSRRAPLVPALGDASFGHNPSLADPLPIQPDGFYSFRPESFLTPREETHSVSVDAPSSTRSFWSRGGTNLVAGGAITVLTYAALANFWNPAGWVAGGAAALLLAGGIAGSAAGGVQLWMSYSGLTTAEQDAELTRASSTPLLISSPVSLVAGAAGAVATGDARGFEDWAFWGGFVEGGLNLAAAAPVALRAIPEMWRAAVPWAQAIFLSPAWFLMSAGGGGFGNVRRTARVVALTRARTIVNVEYLGKTSMTQTDAAWARYQIFATGSRKESVFRVTTADGKVRLVFADSYHQAQAMITEAKYGNMGQMFNPDREAHIIDQARTYLDLTTGRVRYVVSTELGATRLNQRFSLEFPEAMASERMSVEWVPWEPE